MSTNISTSDVGVVATTANPYAQLFKDYREHRLDRETFYMTLYTKSLAEPAVLGDLRFKSQPIEPYELRNSIQKMEADLKDKSQTERRKILREFTLRARESHRSYYDDCENAKAKNESNKFFLGEMKSFFLEVGRVR